MDTVDKAGMAGDIVGSASHGARSTDRIAVDTVSTAATANSSDTADTGNPYKERSRGLCLSLYSAAGYDKRSDQCNCQE